MSESIGMVILAAGKGTRMKVETPKALAPALGRPLLNYVVDACLGFAERNSLSAEVGLVIGHRKELLEAWHQQHPQRSRLKLAWQREQKGTADALKSCFQDLPHFWQHDYILVANADTPLITEAEFDALFSELRREPGLVGVAAVFSTSAPTGYGRIVAGGKGFHIVEEKDATAEEKKIQTVNSGCYILRTSHVKEVLGKIQSTNKAGEFYLTDLFQDAYPVRAVGFSAETPFLGVNTMEQLWAVSEVLKERGLRKFFADGVRILSPSSFHFDHGVRIGVGAVIYPGVTIVGASSIGAGVSVESGSFIRDSQVEDGAEILANSYLEGARVASKATIGPMARLRQGADIGPESKIGNFVEVKKARLERGVKVSHLSYIGDAEIGENSNIGCGFITCNYDGANKHQTKIGRNSFIGSDCQAIAPIEIGNDAFVAAGTTLTKSVPDGAFAIARAQLTVKEGAAKRFLKSKKP